MKTQLVNHKHVLKLQHCSNIILTNKNTIIRNNKVKVVMSVSLFINLRQDDNYTSAFFLINKFSRSSILDFTFHNLNNVP